MLAQQLLNGLALGSIYSLVALGFTMVYGILFMMNMPHGDVLMVGAYVALVVLGYLGGLWGLIIAMVMAVSAASILGIVMEKLAYKPLRKARRIAPLLSAFGVVIVLENGAMLIWGPEIRAFPRVLEFQAFTVFGIYIYPLIILIFITSVVLMFGLQVFVHKTKIGIAIQATSQDRDTAKLMGISLDRAISTTFAVGSGLGAIAGLELALYWNVIYPTIGFPVMIKSFAACVLGGIGNIWGAMLGGMLMGMIEVLAVGYISSGYRDAIAFSVIILFLLFKPSGLLGGREEVVT